VRFLAGGDGYSSGFRCGVKPWLGSDGVGDRNGFFLITMGSFARDGVVGLGPLPVPPERLAVPAHGNWGSISHRCVAKGL